jgi:hypothetical protein
LKEREKKELKERPVSENFHIQLAINLKACKPYAFAAFQSQQAINLYSVHRPICRANFDIIRMLLTLLNLELTELKM